MLILEVYLIMNEDKMEELLKQILDELKIQTKILEETSKDTNFQMRRMATRLEEIKL